MKMGELTDLPNIGEKLERQLNDVRITTLEGAIQGVRWHYLDEKTKESLKAFYHQHKGK